MATQEEIEAVRDNLADYGLSDEVISLAIDIFGVHAADALDGGAYQGKYNSLSHYASEYVDEIGLLHGLDDVIVKYFDFESYGRDLVSGGDVVYENGHVFIAN